jgi:toxin ParE1/3/4
MEGVSQVTCEKDKNTVTENRNMKQWRVFKQKQADKDTEDIWQYIAEDNAAAADAFLDALEKLSDLLSTFPEIGGLRYFYSEELRGLRILPLNGFEKYLIFYRLNEEEHIVEVVRILHGSRDLPALFGTSTRENERGGEQKAA